uniref:DUF7067 domain-containing protein n=1 Tax=Aegilops tauschii subsp. strangulata TaxID=200361 RepID=A0A453RHD8_AEGTS
FLVFDEARNKWFKNNGQNFLIQLQTSHNEGQDAPGASASAIVVPEDLVQIQSYLRWERNGKQSYTADQEKASSMINLHLTLGLHKLILFFVIFH